MAPNNIRSVFSSAAARWCMLAVATHFRGMPRGAEAKQCPLIRVQRFAQGTKGSSARRSSVPMDFTTSHRLCCAASDARRNALEKRRSWRSPPSAIAGFFCSAAGTALELYFIFQGDAITLQQWGWRPGDARALVLRLGAEPTAGSGKKPRAQADDRPEQHVFDAGVLPAPLKRVHARDGVSGRDAECRQRSLHRPADTTRKPARTRR